MPNKNKLPSSKPKYLFSIQQGVANKDKRNNDFSFVVSGGRRFWRGKNGVELTEKEMDEQLPIPADYKAKENVDKTKAFLH
jgi:hypothetical protein